MDREVGKEVLTVEGLSKTIDGVKVLNNVSFRIERTDKVAFVGENENSATALFKLAVANNVHNFVEHRYALLELSLLGQDQDDLAESDQQ